MLEECRALKNNIYRDIIDFEHSLSLLDAELGLYIQGICVIDREKLKDGIWKDYSISKMSFLEKIETYEFELFELKQKKPSSIREEKSLKQLEKNYDKLESLLRDSPNILNEQIATYVFNHFIQERANEAKEDLYDQDELKELSEEIGTFIREYSRFLSLDDAATLIGTFSTIKNMVQNDDGESESSGGDNLTKIEEINKNLNEGVEKIIQLRNINLELDNVYYKIFHGMASTLNVDMTENLDNMTDLKKRIDSSWEFITNFKKTLVHSILIIKEMDLEKSQDDMILDVLKKIKSGNQRRKRHSAVIKEKSQKLRELVNKFTAHLISRMYELNKELEDSGFIGSALNEAREVAAIANRFLKEFNEILKQSRVLYEKFTNRLVDFIDQLPRVQQVDHLGRDFNPSKWSVSEDDESAIPASLAFLKNPPENHRKKTSSLIFGNKIKGNLKKHSPEIIGQVPTGELGLKEEEMHILLKKISRVEKEVRNIKSDFQKFVKDYCKREFKAELLKELNDNIKELLRKK